MIDIIIAAYNAQDTIEETLYSILLQENSDQLNVYIINDNPENNYKDIVQKFSKYINIKEYKMRKNMGPGEARNYGIKHSKSKYIIFMDSDDMFHNCYSAKLLYDYIEATNSDIVAGSFLEEIGFCSYNIRNNELIWDHGKIYRRSFIEENDIKFSAEKTNEDTFFNITFKLLDAKITYIDDVTYVWQKNLKSITRKDNFAYRYTALDSYNNNIYMLVQEGEKRKVKPERIARTLFYGLIQMYYTYLSFYSENDLKSVNNLLKASYKNRKLYEKYKDSLLYEDLADLMKKEIEKNLNCDLKSLFLSNRTFDDFIDEGENI